MAKPRVLVLRAAGINCDEETMYCWRLAGARPVLLHVNELAEKPAALSEVDIVTIPGGFSYGDDIAAGAILAQRLMHGLLEPMVDLVGRGGGILGICNGFQVLVKAGLLPGSGQGEPVVTVSYNDSSRFEARWVRMRVCTDRCPFLTADSLLEMPVEHAEGKVVVANQQAVEQLRREGAIAVRYVDEAGRHDQYPANPNGSDDGIAGLCDKTGRIFGLMPHPDRNFRATHHPTWTSREVDQIPDGLTVFKNAVSHWGT